MKVRSSIGAAVLRDLLKVFKVRKQTGRAKSAGGNSCKKLLDFCTIIPILCFLRD